MAFLGLSWEELSPAIASPTSVSWSCGAPRGVCGEDCNLGEGNGDTDKDSTPSINFTACGTFPDVDVA